jgi:2-polyprenyl-6-methoxyphenol hydroxylase-like FAD-dependent oxidoreductase
MKTLVIGGGIAGLSTAIALEQAGIPCEVFESAPEFREVGAGIWMAPNAMQVFQHLGIADLVARGGFPLRAGELATDKGEVISTMSMEEIARELAGGGEWHSTVAIHRGRLQRILLEQLRPDQIHTGKRFVRYEEENDRIKAVFEDGTEVEGDIILAADGIHSAVRAQMAPNSELRYSGQTCWRGIADLELGKSSYKSMREMWGGADRFGYSPISENEVYWFAVSLAGQGGKDDRTVLSAELKGKYRGFAEPVSKILAATPVEQIIRGDILDLKPISKWYAGRVLLLGDAAHATTPNLGQGGCQAVEDAWTLAGLLHKSEDWERVFPAFEAARREKVDGIVRNSWRMGKLAHWRRGKGLRNWLLRKAPEAAMRRSMKKMYTISQGSES